MKRVLTLLTAVTLICAGVARSEVVPVASTGFDSNGNELTNGGGPDANYTLVVAPAGVTLGNVYAVTSAAGYPVEPAGPWLGDDNSSTWISPSGGAVNAPAGEYDYTTTFNLTNFDPTTFALTGQLSTDNEVLNVLINGDPLGTFGNTGDFGAWTQFNIDQTDAAGDFNAGLNTITFQLENDPFNGNNPTGLRVEIESANANATPEPGTLGLLGSALAGLGFMARRRRSS